MLNIISFKPRPFILNDAIVYHAVPPHQWLDVATISDVIRLQHSEITTIDSGELLNILKQQVQNGWLRQQAGETLLQPKFCRIEITPNHDTPNTPAS
jgi:hypothetical protein